MYLQRAMPKSTAVTSCLIVVLTTIGCDWSLKNKTKIASAERPMSDNHSISSSPGKIKQGMRLDEFEQVIAANSVYPVLTSGRVSLSFYCTPRLPGKVVKVWYESRQNRECIVEKWTIDKRNDIDVFVDLKDTDTTN
ncbi:MAG: hypothetical protein V4719_29495 [Planctomycetota bacterium]